MHVCIVRINCQNKWAGVNPQLLACNCICAVAIGTATNACVSVSSKDTGHCPQRWCSNKKLSAINWPALQRLSFSVVICFVEAVIPSSIGIAHFQPHNISGRRQKNFGERGNPSWHSQIAAISSDVPLGALAISPYLMGMVPKSLFVER